MGGDASAGAGAMAAAVAATVRAVGGRAAFGGEGAGEDLTVVGLEGARERVGEAELVLLVDRERAVVG